LALFGLERRPGIVEDDENEPRVGNDGTHP